MTLTPEELALSAHMAETLDELHKVRSHDDYQPLTLAIDPRTGRTLELGDIIRDNAHRILRGRQP